MKGFAKRSSWAVSDVRHPAPSRVIRKLVLVGRWLWTDFGFRLSG